MKTLSLIMTMPPKIAYGESGIDAHRRREVLNKTQEAAFPMFCKGFSEFTKLA